MREERAPLYVGLLALALLLALLAPVLPAPDQLALGSPVVDLPAGLWTLWWSVQPDAGALANHPAGGVDFHLLTPVSAGLTRLLGGHFVLAWNLSRAVAVVVAVLGGWLWGRQQGGAWGGLLAAVVLGTSPALSSALRDGTGEFTWLGLLALSLWACRRLETRRRILLAGLLLAVTAASCWYYGLAAGLGAVLLAVAGAERRRALPRVLLAGALGLLLVLPLALAFTGSELEPQRLVGPDLLSHLLDGAAGPEPDHDLVASPLLPRTQLVGPGAAPQPLWLLGAGGLALAGLWYKPRGSGPLLLAAGVALVLSLGSSTPGGLPLPMLWLNRLLLWLGAPLHLPFHLGALTTVALAGLAARAVPLLPRGAAVAGLVTLLSLQGTLPMEHLRLERPAPLMAIAGAGEGAVLDLPTVLSDAQEATDSEALHQLVHGQPIPRFPVFPTSLLRDEGIRAARGTALVQALARGSTAAPATADLEALGYRWVVLDAGRGPHLVPVLDRWLGPPWAEGEGLRVYRLGEG